MPNFSCVVCKKEFKRHVERVHNPVQFSLDCKVCGKKYKGITNLKKQMKAKHQNNDTVSSSEVDIEKRKKNCYK